VEERAHASVVPRTSLEAVAGAGLRIGLGLVVLAHGWQKAVDFAAWEHHVAALGFPSPEVLARLAVVAELGGGALMVLGMLVPFAGTVIAATMAIAIATSQLGHFARDGGWELPALLALGGLFFAAYGGGPFGVDAVLARRNREATHERRFVVVRPMLAESRF
jgi:putative oxidoreductase